MSGLNSAPASAAKTPYYPYDIREVWPAETPAASAKAPYIPESGINTATYLAPTTQETQHSDGLRPFRPLKHSSPSSNLDAPKKS